MTTQHTTSRARRTARGAWQVLRIIPAILFLVLPFFLFYAPWRTLSRTHEAPETPRAAAVGLGLWLAGAGVLWVIV